MAKATFIQDGKSIDYTPGSDVAAGDVVVQGSLVGIAKTPIAANALGALAIVGVFDVAKAQEAFATVGGKVHWDADGDPYGGTAGSGCYTNVEADWDFRTGVALYDAADTDAVLYFDLNRFSGDPAERLALVRVEDLAAGADISGRPIFVHPRKVTLSSVGILTEGAPADVDDSNTAVLEVADDADNSIVSKTYSTATQPPDADYEDIGALSATHKVLAAGEHLKLNVTQGTTADLPAFSLVLRYVPVTD